MCEFLLPSILDRDEVSDKIADTVYHTTNNAIQSIHMLNCSTPHEILPTWWWFLTCSFRSIQDTCSAYQHCGPWFCTYLWNFQSVRAVHVNNLPSDHMSNMHLAAQSLFETVSVLQRTTSRPTPARPSPPRPNQRRPPRRRRNRPATRRNPRVIKNRRASRKRSPNQSLRRVNKNKVSNEMRYVNEIHVITGK